MSVLQNWSMLKTVCFNILRPVQLTFMIFIKLRANSHPPHKEEQILDEI